MESVVAEQESALELPEHIDVHLGHAAVPVEPVAVRGNLADHQPIGLTLVAQYNWAFHGVLGAGPPAVCGGEEGTALTSGLGVVHGDSGGQQRDRCGGRG